VNFSLEVKAFNSSVPCKSTMRYADIVLESSITFKLRVFTNMVIPIGYPCIHLRSGACLEFWNERAR
jgi:hypothetical protein